MRKSGRQNLFDLFFERLSFHFFLSFCFPQPSPLIMNCSHETYNEKTPFLYFLINVQRAPGTGKDSTTLSRLLVSLFF